VLAAGAQESPAASDARNRLCRTYWYPLYAFARRHGWDPADAEDLTQQFFAQLLARDYLARADPAKGRFRAFLLAGIKNLLADEHDRARCLKRGGGARVISLDGVDAEQRYRVEPLDKVTPERLFERSWVAMLLDAAAGRLRGEYEASGRGDLHDAIAEFRLDAAGQPAYADVAARLATTESAVKSAIWRLRKRYQELVRDEVAQTVADSSEVDDEIRYLLRVMEPA
jgi:DNA-directed RNA polymerase specialized sigma24 family protein